MLVLSRYCDESVCIGDDIVITVVDVRSDRVRLGIKAPSSVSVHRQEVYDAIAREKEGEVKGQHRERGVSIKDRFPRGRIIGRANGQNISNRQKTKTTKPPLEEKLPERHGNALPIEIETHNIGFGGIADILDN
jgi:carbon storage regulator